MRAGEGVKRAARPSGFFHLGTDALVDAALARVADDPDSADLTGVGDLSAAVGLQAQGGLLAPQLYPGVDDCQQDVRDQGADYR
jgi:hypothetical protein